MINIKSCHNYACNKNSKQGNRKQKSVHDSSRISASEVTTPVILAVRAISYIALGALYH